MNSPAKNGKLILIGVAFIVIGIFAVMLRVSFSSNIYGNEYMSWGVILAGLGIVLFVSGLGFKKTSISILMGFILLVVAFVGYELIRQSIDRNHYDQGHKAFLEVKCEEALKQFDSILNAWRPFDISEYPALAHQEKTECVYYQTATTKQQSGDLSGALVDYINLFDTSDTVVFSDVARENIASLFEQSKPSLLASQETCAKIRFLLREDLTPQRDINLPPFYLACGQVYENDDKWREAISLYEEFLSEFPSHNLESGIEAALARSYVAQAKVSGAGDLSALQHTGSIAGSMSSVVIQNDSPEKLRIVFNGPEPLITELEKCKSCESYEGSGPMFCPEQGPIGRYKLEPGQYDVLVESISDYRTTDWTGRWSLSKGNQYYMCFILIVSEWP